MEIKVASKYFIGPFATQDHFDAISLDSSREQVHGRAGSHCGHVVRFQVVYYIGDGVQSFLHGERVLVVDGLEEVSHLFGSY